MLTRIARVATLVAVALVAVGCTKSLDTSNLESTLKSQLESQLSASGLTVSCPDNIKVETGATFECTATDPSGQSITIEVTQKDDQGNVTWKVTGAGDGASATPTSSPTM
jgi:Domain of unknown function (DUF4333)